MEFWKLLISFAVFYITISDYNVDACTSFICVNSCGAQSESRKGYKLIFANNRDEDIYRPTLPADVWLAKKPDLAKMPYRNGLGEIVCDQSAHEAPYNLCVYGPIDVYGKVPPEYYSTWLGINERGTLGNLLFFLDDTKTIDIIPRGAMVLKYVQTSAWESPEKAMQNLTSEKHQYLAFNYVHLDMSPKDGSYSLYYVNNNDTKPYARMNHDTHSSNYFSVSNSNLERPFRKTDSGKEVFKKLIDSFSYKQNKKELLDSLVGLMQNTTSNMPDETLAQFMKMTGPKYEDIVRRVSSVKANYSGFWHRAHTRTSTIILVDYQDNVEYYEYNLTSWSNDEAANNQVWKLNSFKFKLRPLYKSKVSSSGQKCSNCVSNMIYLLYFAITIAFMNRF